MGQPRPALAPPPLEDKPTRARGHARPEAVGAFAFDSAGLIGAFHGLMIKNATAQAAAQGWASIAFERRKVNERKGFDSGGKLWNKGAQYPKTGTCQAPNPCPALPSKQAISGSVSAGN